MESNMIEYVKPEYESQHAVEVFQQHDEEALIRPDPEEEGQEKPPKYYLLVLKLVNFLHAIFLIVYGAIHIDDCPAQKMIAVSYIVLGGLIFLSNALNSRHDLRVALGGRGIGPKPKLLLWATLILQLLVIGWIIASCYWAYHIESYIDKKDPKSPNYCSENYYNSVFWFNTAALAAMGLFILIACCGYCFVIGKCCIFFIHEIFEQMLNEIFETNKRHLETN